MFLDACFKTLVIGTSALAIDVAGAGCAVFAGAAAAVLAGAVVVALADCCTAKGLVVDVVMG